MDFKWTVALWKGVRDAIQFSLLGAAGIIAAALFGALEPGDLQRYEVPGWMVPLLVGLFAAARNALRRRFGWPV